MGERSTEWLKRPPKKSSSIACNYLPIRVTYKCAHLEHANFQRKTIMFPLLGAVAPQVLSTVVGMATGGGGGEPKPAPAQSSDNI